ncbi:MAG TPA: hypothetical protein VIG71_10725 [Enteractinococcus sp.]
MTYAPNDVEWQALDLIALALRPDWKANKPGPTWFTKTSGTLPHAENFVHCVDALIFYATKAEPRKRTPDIYPDDGKHWEATRPAAVGATERPGKQPICQDHTAYNRATCPICTDEINDGTRTPGQRGKKIRHIIPSPGILATNDR